MYIVTLANLARMVLTQVFSVGSARAPEEGDGRGG